MNFKDMAGKTVDEYKDSIVNVSEQIHSEPELGHQEYKASKLLVEELKKHGFETKLGVAGMETAFIARRGKGTPVIGVLSEYDALPGIGHACGHNLIASASLVAGLAVARSLDAERGEVWVIGSPAEETFGGKIVLLRSGRLKGLDAAMMFHPGPETRVCSVASVATEPTEIVFHSEQVPGSRTPIRRTPFLLW